MKKITIGGIDITRFHIIYNEKDGETVAFAARELARYIGLACGKEPDIMTRKGAHPELIRRIYVGPSESFGIFEAEGEEDYEYRVFPGVIRIVGGSPRGTLYCAYAFLEEIVGWRFLAPGCEILTGPDEIDVPPTRRRWRPRIEWRDVCSAVYWGEDIAVKRRLNSSYSRNIGKQRGGSFFYPGRFVHTMESLLDVPQHTQPCFSDPENLKKCIESVRTLLRGYPDARIISVTQNDADADEQTHCTCPRCAAIDEEEGSHAGSLLRFVNAVAEAVEDEFPNVRIMTLAYLHTLDCPRITRPRKNVIMEFAPMTMNFARPVTDECNRETVRALEDWSRVTDRIYLWDYVANFSFTVPVFPDFHVLAENVRYYADHHVTGMFMEGDNYMRDGETTDLCELRAYLLSKLLCDPYMSREEFLSHRRDFLLGYYGAGGENIGKFLDIIGEIAMKPGHFVGCFNNPLTLLDRGLFLERMPEMETLWNSAEAGAATEAERSHCERSRLSYTFLKLLYAFDLFCSAGDDAREAILQENEKFYRLLKKYGIRPRGMSSELPEVTDFTKNAAVSIYWPEG